MTKEKILENVEKCISAGPFRANLDHSLPSKYLPGTRTENSVFSFTGGYISAGFRQ